MIMNRNNEQGVALVITLFLMASLSALAVSLMFLSQTETSASRNYRTMSQARYAGEAGVAQGDQLPDEHRLHRTRCRPRSPA